MRSPKISLVERLRQSILPTRNQLLPRLLFAKRLSPKILEEIEESLILADVGVETSERIIAGIKENYKRHKDKDVRELLRCEVSNILKKNAKGLSFSEESPTIILITGVNGTGKTTTVAKMAKRFRDEGRRVLVAAADTYRASAIEQLDILAHRAGAQVIKQEAGADPGAVVYDSILAAKKRGFDVLLIDTAGRLHTKFNLMNELKKIKKVCRNLVFSAPHETFLVIDATTGQNAIKQARMFNEAVGITGICVAKLDGTAKGGVIIAILDQLKIPIKLIGHGEDLADLSCFRPETFLAALFD